MATILIDYENVSMTDELKGVEYLNENDMRNEQKNVYIVELDMKNRSIEDIAREATLQIIGVMDALVEQQKRGKESAVEKANVLVK